MSDRQTPGWLTQLRERGVLRVATSYAVIAWLLLQIADVTFEPLGMPTWAMPALIVTAAIGFPVALLLAWFLELGDQGLSRDLAGPSEPRPKVHGLRRYADVLIIGLLLAVVAVLLVRQSDLGKPKPPPNPAIAVLPFENLSGDPEQEYFSDGLAEEMLDRLGRVPGLKVIARSSSFGFKGKDVDTQTIAEKLGVTTLLVGSVRRDGPRLRLSARLVDGATGQQLWSGSFDREINDIFAVQAELATAVVDAVLPTAQGVAAIDAAAPTSDLDAYDLYLLSRAQLALRTPAGILKSVDFAEQAVRLDPAFARGQALLANSLLFQAMYMEEEDQGAKAALLRRAESAIHKALAIDTDLSEAQGAYANLLRETGQPGAKEAYLRALELNPNNAGSWHDYAVFLYNVEGRDEESSRATERALELDPRQPATWANYLSGLGGPGSPRWETEYERALRTVGDMPFAVDRLTMPALSSPGYPIQVMQAAVAKARAPSPQNLPLAVNLVRAWIPVDPERAATYVPERLGFRDSPVDMEAVRLIVEADLAGLRGDWALLDRNLALLDERPGVDKARLRAVRAFWLMMRERYDEAAAQLRPDEPVPEMWTPPVMGGDATYGLMESAQLRILRATGRGPEADQLAESLLQALRRERLEAGEDCGRPQRRFKGWMRLASIAASEGLKDEAVDAIRGAMRCGDLPPGFNPQWPWFRDMDGYPPYETLKRERQQRIDRIKPELVRIETEAGLPELARLENARQPPG